MSDDKAIFAANKKRFLGAWPRIAEELTGYLKDAKMPDNAVQWFTKVCAICLQSVDIKISDEANALSPIDRVSTTTRPEVRNPE